MIMNRWFKSTTAAMVVTTMLTTQVTNVLAWDSREDDQMDTHKLIAEQGLRMVEKDLADKEPQKIKDALDVIEKYSLDLRRGSVYPDFGGASYSLYQDHFYNPITNENFTTRWWYPGSVIKTTARDQVVHYIEEAVHLWKIGNYKLSVFQLGCALHYFADVNEPHHTSTDFECMGGPGTAHKKFEEWVEKNKEQYRIYSAGSPTDSISYKGTKDFGKIQDFLMEECYAKASAVHPYASISLLLNSWEEWGRSASFGMTQAQTGTARVIYAFLQEVAGK